MAWLSTLLMLVVVTASAFLRHHADLVGQTVSADQMAWVRQLHRVAATLVLVGAITLVVLARRARDRSALALSSTLLATALLLSVVGVAAGASRAAPVVLVNLLGGFAMLAMCACLATPPASKSLAPASQRAASALLGLLALQVAAGAWASADVSADCLALSACAWPTVMHRIGGLLLGHAVLLFGLIEAWRGRLAGRLLVLVAVATQLFGMFGAAAGSQALPALVVVHNALAALTITLLVVLSRR